MEIEIKIDLLDEKDLTEKYNDDKISKSLLEYLIQEAKFVNKKEKIKIVVNNKCKTKLNYKDIMYESFKEEYVNNLKEHLRNNVLQLVFLLVGVLFIFLSFRIDNQVWKEIFLIGGWVPIWEMIDLELFNDIRGKKRKKILLKLIKSEIVEK